MHRLVAGRPLILAGVTVPAEFGFEGHSDADLLAHAITDALLGAAALGDIGSHFPDSDASWKGADSMLLLRHARELVIAEGFQIVNMDSTVILEKPKLLQYRMPICENLAAALEIGLGRISVKFKTAEKLGPIGEGRSGEAQASVMLWRASPTDDARHS